jgi:CubicO group peptidase (beta-lactamase class C family)
VVIPFLFDKKKCNFRNQKLNFLKIITYIYIILFGWLLLSSGAVRGQKKKKHDLEAIDEVAQKDLKASGAPGAMIAFVQDGKIVYQKPFGISSKKTKVPVNTKTLFLTASVTKIITTTALLMACEKQGITVNTPIGDILEYLPPKLSLITIHEILSMSSGIIDYLPTKKIYKEDVEAYFEHYGDKLVSSQLQSVFSYTNIGHVLAGSILASIMESTFFAAVQELIFDPIKMENTTYFESIAQLEYVTAGHIKGARVDHKLIYPFIQPAASMFSNVNDLSQFAICFMNDGKINNQQVISKSVIKKMSTSYTPIGVLHQYLGYPNSYYNYGLIGFDFKGIHFVGHPGESGSQNILFVMAPTHQAAFILMSNTGSYPFINSFEKMVEIFLPIQNESNTTYDSEVDLKKYVGKYYKPNIQGNNHDVTEIRSRGKNLFIYLNQEEIYPLMHNGKDRFTYNNPMIKFPMEIGFYTDKDVKVKYLNHYWKTSIKIK